MTQETGKTMRVMIVDDEPGILFSVKQLLAEHDVDVFEDPLIALAALSSKEYDILIVDYKMPDLNGIDFLIKARVLTEESYKILLTAFAEKEILQEGINSSLINRVIEKPFRRKIIMEAMEAARGFRHERIQREREVAVLLSEKRGRRDPERGYSTDLVGASGGLKETLSRLEKAATQPVNVLFTGEAGTGKELLAWHLHRQSAGGEAPFHPIDCRDFEEPALEEALFGDDGGNEGAIRLADGGTLLLCGIEVLQPQLQEKLLGVLQDRELVRLGGKPPRRVDFRLMATARVDLHRSLDGGQFREDLYYAVNAFPVQVPPLRQRSSDIPALLEHFVSLHAISCGIDTPEIDPDVALRLQTYRWDGNVRELKNAVHRVVLSLSGERVIRSGMFSFLERDSDPLAADFALDALTDAIISGNMCFTEVGSRLAERLRARAGGDREKLVKMGVPEELFL